MAAALAAHFNDSRWLTDSDNMVYTPSPEVQVAQADYTLVLLLRFQHEGLVKLLVMDF